MHGIAKNLKVSDLGNEFGWNWSLLASLFDVNINAKENPKYKFGTTR